MFLRSGGITMKGNVLITTVCVGLVLLASVFMETLLRNYVPAELVFLVIAVGLSAAVFVGLYHKENWAWPSAVVLVMLLLANLVFLFVQTWALWTFIIALALGAIGGVAAIISLNGCCPKTEEMHYTPLPEVPLETYSPPRARGRPRKA